MCVRLGGFIDRDQGHASFTGAATAVARREVPVPREGVGG